MRLNIFNMKKDLGRPLVLDGAMGTLLIERGVKPYRSLWTTIALISNWELVKQIHEEYAEAGAEIITTNTFNSNPFSVKNSGLDYSSEQLVDLAYKAACEAREDKSLIIAGCNAPAEDCYQPERRISFAELEYNHKKHIELLWESGVDIIWNETQSHLDEIEIIAEFCENNSLPYSINLFFTDDLTLLSQEKISEVIPFLKEKYPNIILGFNCISPEKMFKLIKEVSLDFDWGFYLNCGKSNINEGEIKGKVSPDEYVKYVSKIHNTDNLYIGSCCGSTPQHTKKIKEYLIAQND